MLTQEEKRAIRKAYKSRELRVSAVDPDTTEVCEKPVTNVMRHESSDKHIHKVVTITGREATFTEDHSIFVLVDGKIRPIEASALSPGYKIVVVDDDSIYAEEVQTCLVVENRKFMYDLSVPGPENFVLSNGILAHNSYSIGGISLDIEKSSKYQQIKQNAEGRFDKFMDNKSRTVKIIRGLQQSRYGLGIRSALGGPYSARSGVMTPRKFVGANLF